ncbi:MAG: DUF2516 family protein [Acidimicrobiales bacterium]
MATNISTGVGVLIVLAALGLSVFGIVDAARRPSEAWDRVGQNKVLWIVLLSVSILLDFFFLIGLIISILYLVIARSRLARAETGGPGGAPPGAWGQAPGAYPGTAWPPANPGQPPYPTNPGQPPYPSNPGQSPPAYPAAPGYPPTPVSSPPPAPGPPWPSTPAPPSASPVAGWYADPGGSGQKRYWDGDSWTAELRS